MCVTVNHYKVTDTFKSSRGERKDWLNIFNVPLSSLDSFLSCLGLITTHTHLTLLFHLHHNYCGEDREQSKACDIMPSAIHQPHAHRHKHTHTCTRERTGMLTSQKHPHQYVLPESPCISPNPPPSPGASCFLDWFHLFNDGCANDPSNIADGVTDTTSQEWALDGGLESEGWVILKRADWNMSSTTEGRGKLATPCMQAVFVFPKQTRTPDAENKLITTPWTHF